MSLSLPPPPQVSEFPQKKKWLLFFFLVIRLRFLKKKVKKMLRLFSKTTKGGATHKNPLFFFDTHTHILPFFFFALKHKERYLPPLLLIPISTFGPKLQPISQRLTDLFLFIGLTVSHCIYLLSDSPVQMTQFFFTSSLLLQPTTISYIFSGRQKNKKYGRCPLI